MTGGAMAKEKEESSKTLENGTILPHKPSQAEQLEAVQGVVLFCGEADRRLRLEYVAIIESVMGKALKGDPSSIKLLLELGERAGRADKIPVEEFVSLGVLLMQEFHALPGEDNGQ